MGILLPPVSQVTNTRINLTQHHRNRSLDSALQRIPEVMYIKFQYFFFHFIMILCFIKKKNIINKHTFFFFLYNIIFFY